MPEEFMDFLADDAPAQPAAPSRAWKVMIVDDDAAVHEATMFSLRRFHFLGRSIQWISAYSAQEAKILLETEREIAVLFLDVVMEQDDAGLAFAKWYRQKNINSCTRIILRTGQPGQAPEREIIVEYDLHDYKTKTELTSDKLFTTTVSALRAYHDMRRLEETRIGLEGIVKSTATIVKLQTMYEYARNVLKQIESILDIQSSGTICAQNMGTEGWTILAKSGSFTNTYETIFSILDKTSRLGVLEFAQSGFMVRILSEDKQARYAIYIEPSDHLNDIQMHMLWTFCNNVSLGIHNIKLYNSLLNANRVTVMSLAQVTELRDHNTGEHVFRIASAADIVLAKLMEYKLYPDELTQEIEMFLGLSATLHDIGKIAVNDDILLKPDKLTDEEFEQIKLHTVYGADILDTIIQHAGEDVFYLEMGKEIALHHHERWDGKGYPHGLKGRQIPIAARITAIVDVFDALTHARCYKPAYSLEQSRAIILEGRGTLFDPLITDVFLEVMEEIAKGAPAKYQNNMLLKEPPNYA